MLIINRYTDPNTFKVTLYGHIIKGGKIQESLGRFDESLIDRLTRFHKYYMYRDVLKASSLDSIEIISRK